MQLICLPGFFNVDLEVVSVVDLLLYVFIHLPHDLGLVRDLVVQCLDSSGGALVVFSQFDEVLLVEVLDRGLVIEGVHGGVLQDGLDTLLLGELD